MIGELNKVFDRNFVIGYVVPAVVFVGGAVGMAAVFEVLPDWLAFKKEDVLKDTTVLALAVVLGAVLLLAINREAFRTLEGYWYGPLGVPFITLQRWRFRRLHARKELLDQEFADCARTGQALSNEKRRERRELHQILSNQFPREEFILPTCFGNTVRAYEDYARAMYGFESITGWSRLHTVISKEFLEVVNGARAALDLWVNLWFVSLLLGAVYIAIATCTGSWIHAWIPVACVIAALGASWRARGSAERWGEYVKTVFDVYLPALCEKLGYVLPKKHDEVKAFWELFSQAIIFRNVDKLRALEAYRKQDAPAASGATASTPSLVAIAVDLSPW